MQVRRPPHSLSLTSPSLTRSGSPTRPQVDYADMWDIMAFFRGGINNEGAHDDLGKEIAVAGKEWVRECYRWADLEAYQFRCASRFLLLLRRDAGP